MLSVSLWACLAIAEGLWFRVVIGKLVATQINSLTIDMFSVPEE